MLIEHLSFSFSAEEKAVSVVVIILQFNPEFLLSASSRLSLSSFKHSLNSIMVVVSCFMFF